MAGLEGHLFQAKGADERLDVREGIDHRAVLRVAGLDGRQQAGVDPPLQHGRPVAQFRDVPLGLGLLDNVLIRLDSPDILLYPGVDGLGDKIKQVLHLNVHRSKVQYLLVAFTHGVDQ